MEVWAGMISASTMTMTRIFEAQRRFLTEARISTAMVGMLSAIPRTPLYDRLRGGPARRGRRSGVRHQCAAAAR